MSKNAGRKEELAVGYQVGIDIGTTFTAAAVHRDGRSRIFGLGSQSASIPSAVLLREDETELTGEAAVRRALNEPDRVAREFKRRLGDTAPIIVGGAPYSAEQLMARLLTRTITDIAKREDGAPDRVAVAHPANWGPYKMDLFQQAVQIAGVPADRVDLISEPEAAAISYATQHPVETGQVVAVYDLGGGTFDAAILERTDDGFEMMGRPEGIERMGGIDFDAAVYAHVDRALDGKLQELDPTDSMVISGLARLREECVDAKIALSSDTDATVRVLLPNLQTEVPITRGEFESLIRPSLADSIAAMYRALESAGIGAADVAKVVLVGGSSRIPLVSQMVSSALGRPVTVDADPKHAVALGAATFAAGALKSSQHTGAAAATAVTEAAVPAAAFEPTTPDSQQVRPPAAHEPTIPMAQQPAPGADSYVTSPTDPGAPAHGEKAVRSSKLPLVLSGVVAFLVLAIGAVLFFGGGGSDDTADEAPLTTDAGQQEEEPVVAEPIETPPAEPESTDAAAPTTDEPAPTSAEPDPTTADPGEEALVVDDSTIQQQVVGVIGPGLGAIVADGVVVLTGRTDSASADAAVSAAQGVAGVVEVRDDITRLEVDEVCTEEIQALDRWACITAVEFDGTTLFAGFDFALPANDPTLNVNGGFHLHFFNGDVDEPIDAGTNAGGLSNGTGIWEVWDDPSGYRTDPFVTFNGVVPSRLCVEVANPTHSIENLDSGTCFPVVTV